MLFYLLILPLRELDSLKAQMTVTTASFPSRKTKTERSNSKSLAKQQKPCKVTGAQNLFATLEKAPHLMVPWRRTTEVPTEANEHPHVEHT